MEISASEQTYPISFDSTFSGLTNQDGAEMNLNMALNTQQLLALIPEAELDTETQDLLATLKNVDIDYILNLEDGVAYMSSPLFSQLLGFPDGSWVSLNYDTILSESGMDFDELMLLAKPTSTCDILQQLLPAPLTSITDYEDTAALLQMVEKRCRRPRIYPKGRCLYGTSGSYL